MPYVVGLTGGIGSGKSTVAHFFQTLGVPLVDTDAISRKLTAPGGEAISMIKTEMGDEFISRDGGLDRPMVRQRVFSDPDAKHKLEKILHPMIRAEVDAQIASSRADYVVVDIPLLVESGAYQDRIQRVVVVDCEENLQIERTMARSKLTAPDVQAIMVTQATRRERLRHADDIVVNESGLESLSSSVAVLDQRLKALAKLAVVEKRA
jgi:dephospho-CoA kinase